MICAGCGADVEMTSDSDLVDRGLCAQCEEAITVTGSAWVAAESNGDDDGA